MRAWLFRSLFEIVGTSIECLPQLIETAETFGHAVALIGSSPRAETLPRGALRRGCDTDRIALAFSFPVVSIDAPPLHEPKSASCMSSTITRWPGASPLAGITTPLTTLPTSVC